MKSHIDAVAINIADFQNPHIFITIGWTDEEMGFGSINVIAFTNEKTVIESEFMDKEIIREIMVALVDDATLIDF